MQNLAVRIDARNLYPSSINNLPARARAVAEEEAAKAGIGVDRLFGPYADRVTSHARFRAFYRLRQMVAADGLPFSTPRIGSWFNRDHSTVIHGLRRAEKLMAEEARAA